MCRYVLLDKTPVQESFANSGQTCELSRISGRTFELTTSLSRPGALLSPALLSYSYWSKPASTEKDAGGSPLALESCRKQNSSKLTPTDRKSTRLNSSHWE